MPTTELPPAICIYSIGVINCLAAQTFSLSPRHVHTYVRRVRFFACRRRTRYDSMFSLSWAWARQYIPGARYIAKNYRWTQKRKREGEEKREKGTGKRERERGEAERGKEKKYSFDTEAWDGSRLLRSQISASLRQDYPLPTHPHLSSSHRTI